MIAAAKRNGETPCWVTLVTKPSYLPGVIILAHTLDKHKSHYPFIVQYADSLGEEAIAALKNEAQNHGRIVPMHVELLLPRTGQENTGSVATRFKDTFTKLRAFQVYELGFTQAAFLDADMAIFRNPDQIFDIKLPGKDWLGANHICCCNLDKDSWAPSHWTKYNCAYTALRGPLDVAPVPKLNDRSTYRSLNGGLLTFCPSAELWERLLHFFNTTDRLKEYQFPDQDFLDEFFSEKWQPVSWKYNAIKTMRYWHPHLWSDDELVILHYIVDKPWERKVSKEGVAGHLGRDGVTHQWWWDVYEEWRKARQAGTDQSTVKVMDGLINNEEPFTKTTPLPEPPGRPEEVVAQ